MNLKRYIVAIILTICGVFAISPVFSQPPPPPPPPPCWPPPCTIPINSGIILLIAAGVLFGAYILYKKEFKRSF